MRYRAWTLPTLLIGILALEPAEAGLAASVRGFGGPDGEAPPARLSQTGLYASMEGNARTIADGIVPFQVNSPLWSDGAAKDRFISLPPGAKVVPTDTDSYAFPEGTVFIKNFRVDTVYGDSSSRILVETRFLVKHAGETPEANPWHGICYKWARDQSDAELVSLDMGENIVINVVQNGVVRGKRWTYPSTHQCNTCHFNRGVLGFITPQLNRPSPADASVNQLQWLRDQGVLSANPVAGKPNAFHWAGLQDTAATLEIRARSYFASNCSHCHGNGPPGSSPGDHVFDFFHPETSIDQGPEGLNGAYVGKITHQGGDPFPRFIYKGYPESSYVLKRMSVRQDLEFTPTEQMPTLATFQPDSAALMLMKNWICSMGSRPSGSCRLPQVQTDGSYWDMPAALHGILRETRRGAPGIAKGILRVTPGLLGEGRLPRLYDVHGRTVRLVRAGRWEYRALSPLRPGIYVVRTDAGTAVVHSLP